MFFVVLCVVVFCSQINLVMNVWAASAAPGGEPKGTEGAPRVAWREVLGSAWDEWFRVDSSST